MQPTRIIGDVTTARLPQILFVPDAELDALRGRLNATRWPLSGSGAGCDADELHRLVNYWSQGFDWRAQEAAIQQGRRRARACCAFLCRGAASRTPKVPASWRHLEAQANAIAEQIGRISRLRGAHAAGRKGGDALRHVLAVRAQLWMVVRPTSTAKTAVVRCLAQVI